jgi:hypothetical protein
MNEETLLWYEYACTYSLAANRLSAKQIEYADRAMELLTQAVKFGYDNATRLRSDSDLTLLQDRDDFRKLVAELESKANASKLISKPPSASTE